MNRTRSPQRIFSDTSHFFPTFLQLYYPMGVSLERDTTQRLNAWASVS